MQSDPRPVLCLLLAGLGGLGLLAGWWSTLPEGERLARLQRVWVQEQVATPPQIGLLEQPCWLVQHRLARGQGMVVLVSVAGVMGLAEGMARRAGDVLGGFRLTAWTVGVVLAALVPVIVAGYLVLPWPVPLRGMAWGLSGVVGMAGWLLGLGRPYVP